MEIENKTEEWLKYYKKWNQSQATIDDSGYDVKRVILASKYGKNQNYGYAGAARTALLSSSLLSTAAVSVFSLGTITPLKIALCSGASVALEATLNETLRHYYYQHEFIVKFLEGNEELRKQTLEEIENSSRYKDEDQGKKVISDEFKNLTKIKISNNRISAKDFKNIIDFSNYYAYSKLTMAKKASAIAAGVVGTATSAGVTALPIDHDLLTNTISGTAVTAGKLATEFATKIFFNDTQTLSEITKESVISWVSMIVGIEGGQILESAESYLPIHIHNHLNPHPQDDPAIDRKLTTLSSIHNDKSVHHDLSPDVHIDANDKLRGDHEALKERIELLKNAYYDPNLTINDLLKFYTNPEYYISPHIANKEDVANLYKMKAIIEQHPSIGEVKVNDRDSVILPKNYENVLQHIHDYADRMKECAKLMEKSLEQHPSLNRIDLNYIKHLAYIKQNEGDTVHEHNPIPTINEPNPKSTHPPITHHDEPNHSNDEGGDDPKNPQREDRPHNEGGDDPKNPQKENHPHEDSEQLKNPEKAGVGHTPSSVAIASTAAAVTSVASVAAAAAGINDAESLRTQFPIKTFTPKGQVEKGFQEKTKAILYIPSNLHTNTCLERSSRKELQEALAQEGGEDFVLCEKQGDEKTLNIFAKENSPPIIIQDVRLKNTDIKVEFSENKVTLSRVERDPNNKEQDNNLNDILGKIKINVYVKGYEHNVINASIIQNNEEHIMQGQKTQNLLGKKQELLSKITPPFLPACNRER